MVGFRLPLLEFRDIHLQLFYVRFLASSSFRPVSAGHKRHWSAKLESTAERSPWAWAFCSSRGIVRLTIKHVNNTEVTRCYNLAYMTDHRIQVLTLIVQALTLSGLIWYAIETWKIRNAALKQVQASRSGGRTVEAMSYLRW